MTHMKKIQKREFYLKRKNKLSVKEIQLVEHNYKIIKKIRKQKRLESNSEDLLADKFDTQIQISQEAPVSPPPKLQVVESMVFTTPLCTSTPKLRRNETAASDQDLFAGCQSQVRSATEDFHGIPANTQKDPVNEDEIISSSFKQPAEESPKKIDSAVPPKKKRGRKKKQEVVKKELEVSRVPPNSPRTLEKIKRIQEESRLMLERLEYEDDMEFNNESGYHTLISSGPSDSSSNKSDPNRKLQEVRLTVSQMREISNKLKISETEFHCIVKSVVSQHKDWNQNYCFLPYYLIFVFVKKT